MYLGYAFIVLHLKEFAKRLLMSIRLIKYISPNMELCIARGLLCYRHSICQSVCDLMSNALLVRTFIGCHLCCTLFAYVHGKPFVHAVQYMYTVLTYLPFMTHLYINVLLHHT